MSNFYFTDRKYNLIDVVSTDGNTDIVVTAIKDIQSIEESARDFEATLFFNDDDFKLVKQLSRVGNFVLYKDREGQSVFITIESREINATDGLVMITGKDASIDLINEIVAPYSPDKSYSIAEYILRFTNDSGFEIGENAIPDKKLKLEEWTSEATALERILSVATRFDVELSFSFEISGLDVIKRYINISEKRGKDENVTLYANREIENITIKEDSFDLFTAIKPIGAILEGKETPINLNNYKYTDPNGRYVLSGGILRDNMVVQEWSRLLSNENTNPTTAHITRYKEYDTDNQAKLFTMAMTDLKKYAQLNVNYDVAFYEFPTTVSIGDTINIVDEDKEIYLSARVLTLTYDYVTETAEAVVGDYLIKESGISQDLENLASSMKDKFANVNENLNGKAVIVKSETAPEPNENIIWIDTSHPQTPIKTYDPETGEWLVSTGEKGKDGIAGKDGLGVLSTVITYAISASGITTPTGGWTAQVPTLEKGKYLWTKTQWTYTDGSTENGYTVSYIAKDGNDGEDGYAGKDGVGISNTKVEYVGSTSGTTRPTSGWSTTIPTVAEGNFLWTRTTWTYTDNTSEMGYSVAKMGAKGDKGDKGDTGAKGSDGIAGKDGVGLKETIIRYAGSSNGTTAPTSGWQSTVPVVSAGSFLWTRTTWTYTDDSSEIGYSVSRIGADGNNGEDGIAGKDGTGILSTTITYASSTSGVNAPTSGWTSIIPTVADGNFLWTKTVWAYTDNTSETGYSVAKMGAKGADGKDGIAGKDGVGIKTTTIQYAGSTSGTTAPTTGWQTNVPTVSAGNYLWTKNTWTYTDNSTEVGYSVSRIGKDGNTGKDGVAGKDGTGIKATSIQYAGSTSGTTPPTTGWTASVPTVASGSYLWTKTTWSYTDDTNETGYSVSRMGETGAKGDTGDSATSYWVTPSVNAIKISASKVLSPSTVTFTGYAKTGTANTVTYSGRFNVMTSTDGIVYSSVYVSTANQSTYTYTIPTTVKFIKVRMYLAGGTSVLLDEQTIPILESAEDLEIGGRNLQPDTFNFSSKAFRSLTSSTVITKESTGSWVEVATGVTTTELNFVDIGENQQFTVSFDCMTTNTTINGTQMILVQYFNSSGTRINYEWVYGSYGNSWKRFNLTSTTPAGTTKIGLGFRSTSNSLRYRLVKLELGNKATAWTPALEDAQLYNAWSNDPNGKDMVRVYPNENILLGTTSETQTITTSSGWPDKTGATNALMAVGDGRLLKAGDTVTYSAYITAPTDTRAYIYVRLNRPNAPNGSYEDKTSNRLDAGTSGWCSVTVTIPSDTTSIRFTVGRYENNTAVSRTLSWSQEKAEKGSEQTAWTASPSENPVKAEMAYIGYSVKNSNNPADYVWSENPKAKGTYKRWANSPDGKVDFTDTYPNPNLFDITRPEVRNPATTKAEFLNNPNWDMAPIFDTYGANVPYTLSFDLKSAVAGGINVYSQNGSGTKYNIGTTTLQATTEFKRFSIVIIPQLQSNTYPQTQALLAFYGTYDSGRIPTVRNLKLEFGAKQTIDTPSASEDLLATIPQYIGISNKNSDNPADYVWTVTPEYTQARTDLGLESKVDDETFNDAQDHMNEQIDSKASADELQALAELTENLKESYEGFISDGGKYEADLQALEARATGLLLDLEDKVLDLDFLKTRMRLGEEGFEIGAEESSMKMLLTNDRLSFMDSGKEIAYFSNQQFKINRGAILESIQIGSHKITKISDKMTVFQFVPPL